MIYNLPDYFLTPAGIILSKSFPCHLITTQILHSDDVAYFCPFMIFDLIFCLGAAEGGVCCCSFVA
jgi:hypothetical protein